MKKIFYLVFLLMSMNKIIAQSKSIYNFIPKGYDTLGIASGDLNNDKIKDYALALYHKSEKLENQNPDSVPPRMLVILFGSKSGYIQSIKSSTIILCKDCGGVFGDPFNEVTIKNNVLTVSHMGGSAEKWLIDDKFRFQNNDWYLIGQRRYSFLSTKYCKVLDDYAGTDIKDVNFITGDIITKKISENCKLTENKKGKVKIKPLVLLSKFSTEQ